MSARFDSAWLALREPADAAARAAAPLAALQAWAAPRRGLRAVDLGCGSGANLRWLAPRLPGPQHWRLIDRDPELLAAAATAAPVDAAGGPVALEAARRDLAAAPADLVGDADLVTASALLDLVSARWLEAVVAACRARGAAALFTLSYDGRFASGMADADEAAVRAAVNAHQRRDKGLGPALGPAAGHHAGAAFVRAGFRVTGGASPWRLGPERAALQRALVEAWRMAARARRPQAAARFDAWAARRRARIDAGTEALRVGHYDLFAAPPAA